MLKNQKQLLVRWNDFTKKL